MVDIESRSIVTKRKENIISDGDAIRNSRDDHSYHEGDVESDNDEVVNNYDGFVEQIMS